LHDRAACLTAAGRTGSNSMRALAFPPSISRNPTDTGSVKRRGPALPGLT
jgi:hypothetical protein